MGRGRGCERGGVNLSDWGMRIGFGGMRVLMGYNFLLHVISPNGSNKISKLKRANRACGHAKLEITQHVVML